MIIWEIRDIPLGNKDKLNLFVRCCLDPTGWAADQIIKMTDTHMNSSDGYGVFNYRFKFDISVPCEFPRIKFDVLETGLTSDDGLGSAMINLKRTMNKLKKEESISVPKSYLALTLP